MLVSLVQVLPEELVVGGPRWVSQWATLAASHIRTDPEGSGGESHIMVTEDRGTPNVIHVNTYLGPQLI